MLLTTIKAMHSVNVCCKGSIQYYFPFFPRLMVRNLPWSGTGLGWGGVGEGEGGVGLARTRYIDRVFQGRQTRGSSSCSCSLSLQGLPMPASILRPVRQYKCRHQLGRCVSEKIAKQRGSLQWEMSALFSLVSTWVHLSLLGSRELVCQLSRMWEACRIR